MEKTGRRKIALTSVFGHTHIQMKETFWMTRHYPARNAIWGRGGDKPLKNRTDNKDIP